jgi:pteridine reductase
MSAKPLAIITGGIRRVGAVIAAHFAAAGYDLALISHADTQPEAELADAFERAEARWHVFTADLSDLATIDPLMSEISAHFGRTPDVLINNAAMFGQDDWTQMDAGSLKANFALNTFAPILLSRAMVLAATDTRPSIVHILDQRIQNPHGDQISYTLSKQALASSVRSMAAAFGPRARVNGVAPGLVISTEDYNDALETRLAAMMPLGALPDPSGVAQAALYLASAAHVTGQIIFADGGAHLKSFDRDFMHL